MKYHLICFILITSFVFADWCDHVKSLKLNNQNYKQYIGGSQTVVVEFFTPWCPHCEKMANVWNQVYQRYNGDQIAGNNDIIIAKMNCDKKLDNDVCKSYGVDSYPTIMYFEPQNDQGVKYLGHRTFQQISQWIDLVYSQ